MLVDLDESETLRVKLVEGCLDGGGLSGPGIAIEKYVVGTLPFHKSKGVVIDLLLLQFISHKVIVVYRLQVVDRDKLRRTVNIISDTESFIETKHSDAVVFIVFRDGIIKALPSTGREKSDLQRVYGF